MWSFVYSSNLRIWKKVPKTSERFGANVDIMKSNIISGKSNAKERCLCCGWIYKKGISHRKAHQYNKAFQNLKLFTCRFIHCFPMCEITPQIKERPYSSPGFWEHPNLTDESRSGAVDDIQCHLVAITTHYNMIDDWWQQWKHK